MSTERQSVAWLVSNHDGTCALLDARPSVAAGHKAAYRRALENGDAIAAASALEQIRKAEGGALTDSDRLFLGAILTAPRIARLREIASAL
jgi:hypothetical protein